MKKLFEKLVAIYGILRNKYNICFSVSVKVDSKSSPSIKRTGFNLTLPDSTPGFFIEFTKECLQIEMERRKYMAYAPDFKVRDFLLDMGYLLPDVVLGGGFALSGMEPRWYWIIVPENADEINSAAAVIKEQEQIDYLGQDIPINCSDNIDLFKELARYKRRSEDQWYILNSGEWILLSRTEGESLDRATLQEIIKRYEH